MKIALCLHGLVGGIKGKNYQLLGGESEVLDKSFKHNYNNILSKFDTDVFIHSWSVSSKDKILNLYNPKDFIIEPQINFEIPEYINPSGDSFDRAFAHLSRWYSFKKVVELKTLYETKNNFNYDFILVQRFDLCWNIIPDFNSFDINKIVVGNTTLNLDREWSDRWFISNSINMNKFSTLFDMIPVYMMPGGSLPSSAQYQGISSHSLVRHHTLHLGLEPDFRYIFGGYGQKPNDYNEVRRQYYGD